MIIISSGYKNLKEFVDKERDEYLYVDFGCSPSYLRDAMEKKGHRELDIRKALNGIDFRSEFIDFIGKLNLSHHSLYWWANSISYKGAFVTDLFQELYYYYCMVSLLNARPDNFIIISRHQVLNECIAEYCGRNRIECRMLERNRKHTRISHLRRYILSSLCFISRGWRRKYLISMALSKTIKDSLKSNSRYHVIKSWIDKRSFPCNGSYKDLFFGPLPEYLKQKNKDFIILAGSLTDYGDLIGKMKSVKGFPVIPQEYFIGYLDYLKVVFSGFIKRPRLTNGITFRGVEVTDLIKRCLDRDYEAGEVCNNLIYYYCIKGLTKKIVVSSFIYLFENRAWERISILSFKKHSPSTRLNGYVHSSIRQSYLGYFQSREEKDIVPFPDKILTMGRLATSMLSRLGNYNEKVELKDACALRYEYFFKDMPERKKEGKILVAFPIDLAYSLKLLEFLNDAFPAKYNRRIVLRPHPFAPIERLIERRDFRLNDKFEISTHPMLEQDLKDTGALIYTDSTASMEALMQGVPVIHIDLGEPSNSDPLFELDSLKWVRSDKRDLLSVLDYIYAMDNAEYSERYNEAVSYLKRYFCRPEERHLREYIA